MSHFNNVNSCWMETLWYSAEQRHLIYSLRPSVPADHIACVESYVQIKPNWNHGLWKTKLKLKKDILCIDSCNRNILDQCWNSVGQLIQKTSCWCCHYQHTFHPRHTPVEGHHLVGLLVQTMAGHHSTPLPSSAQHRPLCPRWPRHFKFRVPMHNKLQLSHPSELSNRHFVYP